MDDKQLLIYLYQNADMGVDGILQVIGKAERDSAFCAALQSQLAEYDRIRSEALELLRGRQLLPEAPGRLTTLSAEVTAAWESMRDPSTPHLAEMMLRGNAMGLQKIAKRLGEYCGADAEVKTLAGKLLSTEQNNIEQMKDYL